MKFTSWWENKGVAPCYRPFRLAFRLHRDQGNVMLVTQANLRSWLPGDNLYDNAVAIPSDTEAGQYELQLGILDETVDEPRIRLAIAGRRPDGWYTMGNIKVAQ